MRKEYELKSLKVKRRGPLPGLRGKRPDSAKVRITIALDQDVVEYFKEVAGRPGALPYQTQINQALRRSMGQEAEQTMKSSLLEDEDFLQKLAREVAQR